MTLKVTHKKTEETEDVPGTTQRRKIQASPNKNRNNFQNKIYSRGGKKKTVQFLGYQLRKSLQSILPGCEVLTNLSSSDELHMHTLVLEGSNFKFQDFMIQILAHFYLDGILQIMSRPRL